jgi:hypothetical protein
LARTAIVWFLIEMRPINRIGDTTMADVLRTPSTVAQGETMEHNADFLREGVGMLSQKSRDT